MAPVHFVVPLRDQVVERAPHRHPLQHQGGLAEGNAAVHTARSLLPALVLRELSLKLPEVSDPVKHFPGTVLRSFILQKSCFLSHTLSFTRLWTGAVLRSPSMSQSGSPEPHRQCGAPQAFPVISLNADMSACSRVCPEASNRAAALTTRWYSFGTIFLNCGTQLSKSSRISPARRDPVASR